MGSEKDDVELVGTDYDRYECFHYPNPAQQNSKFLIYSGDNRNDSTAIGWPGY